VNPEKPVKIPERPIVNPKNPAKIPEGYNIAY